MAQGILGNQAWAQNIIGWIRWAGIFIIAILISAVIIVLLILIMRKLKEKSVEEISLHTRRIKQLAAKDARGKDGRMYLYVSKYKKNIPQIQQEDIYLKGKMEKIYLLKDNNGLHHTLRLPTEEELKRWYYVVHGIDLDDEAELMKLNEKMKELEQSNSSRNPLQVLKGKINKKQNPLNVVGTLYWKPNIAEDLDWLSEQHGQSDLTFPRVWYKNPGVIFISTMALCVITFIITIVVGKVM